MYRCCTFHSQLRQQQFSRGKFPWDHGFFSGVFRLVSSTQAGRWNLFKFVVVFRRVRSVRPAKQGAAVRSLTLLHGGCHHVVSLCNRPALPCQDRAHSLSREESLLDCTDSLRFGLVSARTRGRSEARGVQRTTTLATNLLAYPQG